jgi:hypothetical protein
MKYETLEEARQAEYKRIIDCGCGEDHAKWSVEGSARVHVEPNDPPKGCEDPPNPKYLEMRDWYNPVTDVLWGYRSYYSGNHGHGYEGDGWRHAITNASKYNPILLYYRQQHLKKELEASYA